MESLPLSVLIPTKNETRDIADRLASVFVLPSYSENFGISVVEAMACGLPLIVSDKVNVWIEIEADGAAAHAPSER